MPDYLFPSSQLKQNPQKPTKPVSPPPTNPVPLLSEIGAAGGLVFSGSTSQTIGVGTTISYSVNVDAGQTLAAIVTPDNNLQATLTITDAKGKIVASATGSAPGATTAVQANTVNKSGTYHVVVGGAKSTAGNFTLQVLVNSLLQSESYLGGPNDGTLADAQPIDTSPLDVGNGINRSAVYGNIPLQASAGDSFVSERGVGVQLVSSAGVVEATLNNPALSAGTINGMHIGPNGNLYIGVDTAPGGGTGGEIVEMTQNGAVVAVINLPSDPNLGGYFYYPFGFSIASDGSLWVAQPNSGNVIHVDGSGNLLNSYAVGGTPEWTAVRADGQVFISQNAGSIIQQLNPSNKNVTTFATDPGGAPFGLSFDGSGNLLVTDPNVGVERFNGSGTLIQTIPDFNAAIDAEVDPSGNVLVATFYSTVDKFSSSGTPISSTTISGPGFGVAVVGTEGPTPTPPQTADNYSFSLDKGQSATAVLSDLGTMAGQVSLVGPDGTVLALGKTISGNEESINSFIASKKGTYYLRVSGLGVQYSLVLETGADFANGGNTSIATAQNLFPSAKGTESVLGSLTSTSLWGVDWQNAANQFIHAINTQTGAFTSTFAGPTTPVTNPFGYNMAFDGTNLWFNDGSQFGSNTLFKLDPSTGAVRGSFAVPTSNLLSGLAYLNGSLWGVDGNSDLYQINPTNGSLVSQFSLAGASVIVGLAGDPSRGVLWAVSQYHTLYEIDPVKQVILKSASDGLGLNEQDLGYYNNELYVSETNGPGQNDIAVFNATTLTETRDLPVNVSTYISGLGADGLSLASPNYYHITAVAKDKLTISATAPYSDPTQGPFTPLNTLNPVLQLWDSQGNLLATSTPGGSINNYKITSGGDYYVSISGSGGTTGDYVLSVSGADGALPAFAVTGTNPPADTYHKPLASITVDFNDSILVSSLTNANVTFGGVSTTGYTVNNEHEVTWYLKATPPGQNVTYTFHIAAGTIQDIHGVGLTGFSEELIINTIPPHLTSTSIEEGKVVSGGNLTYVTSFQEPIDPTSVSASSFDLHGLYRNADFSPTSLSFNSTNTTLTVNYSNLPQDNYTLTLFSPGFADLAGWNLDGLPHTPRPPSVPTGNGQGNTNFFVDFALRHGTETLPVTFGPVAPIGDQVYQGFFSDVIANPAGSTNTYTVSLAANQTLTLDLTSDANLQGTIALYDPSKILVSSVTAASQGSEVVLQSASIGSAGTYTIVVGGAGNTEGLFSIEATLNAAITTGTHGTAATAQSLTSSFLSLGGTSALGAVQGSINQLVVNAGDVYTSERGGPGIIVVANGGGIQSQLDNPAFSAGVIQAIHEGPDGNLYVGLDTAPGAGTGGEILELSPTGSLLATVHLPNDTPSNSYYYPFGFSVAADDSFWVAQPNSGHVVHVSAAGAVIQTYNTGGIPEWTAVRSDGQVFIADISNGTIRQLDPGSGNLSTFATDIYGQPNGLTFTSGGNLLVSDFNVGVQVFNSGGSVVQTVYDYGALDAQLDPSGDFVISNPADESVDKFDPNGNFLTYTNTSGVPIGVSVAGVDGPAPAAPVLDNFYSFTLGAGQSTTVAYNQLSGTGTATITIEDGVGDVLATAVAGPTNFSQVISNFVAGSAGTYYVHVHGNNITYGVTVTKDAAFDSEPNNSQATAQPLPAAGGAVGAIFAPSGVAVATTLEGMNFYDSTCGCIPPDTNDAVGPTQVVEAVNTAIRVYDKTTGNILLTQDLGSLFGISAFSDPYIVYDDIANRFVLTELTSNSQGGDGVALAVSKDSNFMDGFLPTQTVDFGANLLDFDKVGFNADAYVIEGNLFGPSDTPVQIIAVDKKQLFQGNFVYYAYQRHPGYPDHFRAEMPAQMHGATPGMPMYFVEEAGYGNGAAARIVTLTNELSNNPVFTDTDIPVDPYSFPAPADQPGDPGSAATNDTTFSHADWRMINGQGVLVSAQNVSVPDDGYTTSRVRWYEFNTTGTPSLIQQGTINPGPGVSTYYGAPALDINGDIGITYMESSANEYVSMYVTGRQVTDPLGTMSPGVDVAPGIGTDYDFFRTGDYGGMSVDPTNGLTFWAAHEYAGTNPVYNTFLASFTVQHAQDEDWYSVATTANENLKITLTVPGSATGAQFVNNLSPTIQLYDPNGNLLASGSTFLSYVVPSAGSYAVRVLGASNTQGEYVLLVQDPPLKSPVQSGTQQTSNVLMAPGQTGANIAGTPATPPAGRPASSTALSSASMVVPVTSTTLASAGASDAMFAQFGNGTNNTGQQSAAPVSTPTVPPATLSIAQLLAGWNALATADEASNPDLMFALLGDGLNLNWGKQSLSWSTDEWES